VTEQNEDPEDVTQDETATPLPERDAMSVIGGPVRLIDGAITPAPDPGPIKIVPPPRYDV
jgi:hypothetical protein